MSSTTLLNRDSHGRFRSRPMRRATIRRSRSRPRRVRTTRRARSLPMRDEHGRFIGRSLPHHTREASTASVAEPALVKRRWWRYDGPVDPNLPAGYAYKR
jgi:hypothetical protein